MLRPSRLLAGVTFIALLGMVGVALADIVLRLISRIPGQPLEGVVPAAVPGVVDLVQLSLVTVAHLSIAVTFMVGAHVTVDIVANMFPERMRSVTRRLVWAVSFGFMGLCFVEAFGEGRAQLTSGIVSATINLPIWWYWIPVVLGTALSALACFTNFFRRDLPEARRH